MLQCGEGAWFGVFEFASCRGSCGGGVEHDVRETVLSDRELVSGEVRCFWLEGVQVNVDCPFDVQVMPQWVGYVLGAVRVIHRVR